MRKTSCFYYTNANINMKSFELKNCESKEVDSILKRTFQGAGYKLGQNVFTVTCNILLIAEHLISLKIFTRREMSDEKLLGQNIEPRDWYSNFLLLLNTRGQNQLLQCLDVLWNLDLVHPDLAHLQKHARDIFRELGITEISEEISESSREVQDHGTSESQSLLPDEENRLGSNQELSKPNPTYHCTISSSDNQPVKDTIPNKMHGRKIWIFIICTTYTFLAFLIVTLLIGFSFILNEVSHSLQSTTTKHVEIRDLAYPNPKTGKENFAEDTNNTTMAKGSSYPPASAPSKISTISHPPLTFETDSPTKSQFPHAAYFSTVLISKPNDFQNPDKLDILCSPTLMTHLLIKIDEPYIWWEWNIPLPKNCSVFVTALTITGNPYVENLPKIFDNFPNVKNLTIKGSNMCSMNGAFPHLNESTSSNPSARFSYIETLVFSDTSDNNNATSGVSKFCKPFLAQISSFHFDSLKKINISGIPIGLTNKVEIYNLFSKLNSSKTEVHLNNILLETELFNEDKGTNKFHINLLVLRFQNPKSSTAIQTKNNVYNAQKIICDEFRFLN